MNNLIKGKKHDWETVIGLEIHAQLLTKTKAYSSDENITWVANKTGTYTITLEVTDYGGMTSEISKDIARNMGLFILPPCK